MQEKQSDTSRATGNDWLDIQKHQFGELTADFDLQDVEISILFYQIYEQYKSLCLCLAN